MKDKKWIRELAPIAALLIFIVVILILCAVSAGRKKSDSGETEQAVQLEENGELPEESDSGTLAQSGTETETVEEAETITEVQETIEVEGYVPADAVSGNSAEDAAGGAGEGQQGQTGQTQTGQSQTGQGQNQAGKVATGGISGNAVSGNSTSGVKVVKTNMEMLQEMMDYWALGNVEAVEDLSGLSHYREMSASLKDSAHFYYAGDRNAEGKPEGYGIAAYGGDQYYYGGWKNGERSGEGMWLKMYYYSDSDTTSDRAVISHSYNGSWSENLPNGEGHEQYGIDRTKAVSGNRYIQNVMGNFTNGLYDGEMYLMTLDYHGNVKEWTGKATKGVFETFDGRDKEGRVPVCQDAQNPDSHLWIDALENKDQGLTEVRAQCGKKF